MYVRQCSVLQLLIWASYRHFKERLPEAICCLQLVMLMLCCLVSCLVHPHIINLVSPLQVRIISEWHCW